MMLTSPDAWKRQRKFGHTILQGNYHTGYLHLPAAESKRLLVKMLEEPTNYGYWIDQYTARIICRLAYGFPDHSVDLKNNALALLEGISPSGKLPNIFPQLMWIPKPFNPWKKAEEKRHVRERELYFSWRDQVRKEMDEGTARPSWTKTYYESKQQFGFDEHEAAYAVGMMALAGVQTIGSPLNTFVYAMAHYPVWLEKLQEEIDQVCGDRMPCMADSPRLPTLRAILKEGLRWRPPVPTGKLMLLLEIIARC
jgi:cytochrome P450